MKTIKLLLSGKHKEIEEILSLWREDLSFDIWPILEVKPPPFNR